MLEKRLVLRSTDIEKVKGVKKDQAAKIMAHLKAVLQKKKHQLISIKEFCQYYGLDLFDVKQTIGVE